MAFTNEELRSILELAASRPRRVTGDAGSVITQPLVDLIKMHMYLSGLAATGEGGDSVSGVNPLNGIRVTKLNPPGTVT